MPLIVASPRSGPYTIFTVNASPLGSDTVNAKSTELSSSTVTDALDARGWLHELSSPPQTPQVSSTALPPQTPSQSCTQSSDGLSLHTSHSSK